MLAHLGPEPLKRLLTKRQVADNRELFCDRYEQCLEEALDERWVSWTCAHCRRFMALRAMGTPMSQCA